MSCCGGKRQQYPLQSGATTSGMRRTSAGNGIPAGNPRAVFEYAGAIPLAVTGRVTGSRYIFRGHGSRVEIDPRDRRSLAGVPGLREVV